MESNAEIPITNTPNYYFPFYTTDPGTNINNDINVLVEDGIKNVDALRLLMLCDWSLTRAQVVLEMAKQATEDPVKFAQKYLQR